MEPVPPPGEWHPWYADKPWLMQWLNNPQSMYYRVPIAPVPRLSFVPSVYPDIRELILTKRQAWTWAPWAECPYIYAYYVASDQYGRLIAGDSWVEYIDDYDRFLVAVSEWQ